MSELLSNKEDSSNPYEPSELTQEVTRPIGRVVHRPLILSIQWTVVVLCNLIVPLLFGWSMANDRGHLGIVGAILIFLIIGYIGSIYMPLFVLITTRGALFIAMTQVFPLLHFIIGLYSIAFLRLANVTTSDLIRGPQTGFWGGFFLTAMTGTILISLSCLLGFLFRLFTPGRWWLAKRPPE